MSKSKSLSSNELLGIVVVILVGPIIMAHLNDAGALLSALLNTIVGK